MGGKIVFDGVAATERAGLDRDCRVVLTDGEEVHIEARETDAMGSVSWRRVRLYDSRHAIARAILALAKG